MARLPSLYITHGGGPCFWMEFGPPFGPHAFDKLRAYLTGLIASLPERPKAILVISGHWEEDRPTVSTAAKPGMLFDYYGFPEHTYHLSYPAPGAPDLAERVRGLLQAAKIDCGMNGIIEKNKPMARPDATVSRHGTHKLRGNNGFEIFCHHGRWRSFLWRRARNARRTILR
jgi:aromatic ring-opening dioxygenase catalytic subunit (LigB family)